MCVECKCQHDLKDLKDCYIKNIQELWGVINPIYSTVTSFQSCILWKTTLSVSAYAKTIDPCNIVSRRESYSPACESRIRLLYFGQNISLILSKRLDRNHSFALVWLLMCSGGPQSSDGLTGITWCLLTFIIFHHFPVLHQFAIILWDVCFLGDPIMWAIRMFFSFHLLCFQVRRPRWCLELLRVTLEAISECPKSLERSCEVRTLELVQDNTAVFSIMFECCWFLAPWSMAFLMLRQINYDTVVPSLTWIIAYPAVFHLDLTLCISLCHHASPAVNRQDVNQMSHRGSMW